MLVCLLIGSTALAGFGGSRGFSGGRSSSFGRSSFSRPSYSRPSAPVYRAAPASTHTVIHSGGGGHGLLTGMMIGNMMSNNHGGGYYGGQAPVVVQAPGQAVTADQAGVIQAPQMIVQESGWSTFGKFMLGLITILGIISIIAVVLV